MILSTIDSRAIARIAYIPKDMEHFLLIVIQISNLFVICIFLTPLYSIKITDLEKLEKMNGFRTMVGIAYIFSQI